jgi:hypothetical protein
VFLGVANVNVDEGHVPLDGAEGRARVIAGRQALIDTIGHLTELGVTSTTVPPPRTSSIEEYMDHVAWVAEEILPAFPEAGSGL